jgi:hypothetical protein
MRLHDASISSVLVMVLAIAPSLYAVESEAAPQQDVLIGVWQLDVAKSTFVPGPGPIQETRTYSRGPNGVEGTINRRFRDGRSERIEYVAEFDREYPVAGTEAYDHILLTRVDAFTAEAVLSHAGRMYGTARRVIARDGKTMTVTFRADTASGIVVANSSVYQKVDLTGQAPPADTPAAR